MSNYRKFTQSEIDMIRLSPYVVVVHPTRIAYSNELKELYYDQRSHGFTPTQIMTACGLGPDLIGAKRIKSLAYALNRYASYEAYLAHHSAETPTQRLSQKEELKYLRHQNDLLTQENRFLKKSMLIDRKMATP